MAAVIMFGVSTLVIRELRRSVPEVDPELAITIASEQVPLATTHTHLALIVASPHPCTCCTPIIGAQLLRIRDRQQYMLPNPPDGFIPDLATVFNQ